MVSAAADVVVDAVVGYGMVDEDVSGKGQMGIDIWGTKRTV